MAKTQVTFFCKNCGASAAKWIGKCPSCNEWNTYVEEVLHKEKSNLKSTWKPESKKTIKPISLQDIEAWF